MAIELGSYEGLVHVEDEETVARLGAKLDRLKHDLVLVLVRLLLLLELVAVAQQVDQLQINQLAGVFLSVHQTHVSLVSLLETIVRVAVVIDDEGVKTGLAFVLLGLNFRALLGNLVLNSLQAVLEKVAKIIERLRLLENTRRHCLANTT